VLELGSFVAAPFCGMLLADLGADVIKIEGPPDGDPSRTRGDEPKGYAGQYAALNRNKRSVALDLKDPENSRHLEKLLKSADVLLTSIRPRVRGRLGLDYDTVREKCPRIIYCSLTGYGESDEIIDLPAMDTTISALSGLLRLQVDDASLQAGTVPRVAVVDHISGMYACVGILAALHERGPTGQGQEVKTSLLQAALALQTMYLYRTEGGEEEVRENAKLGVARVKSLCLVFRCADEVSIAVHIPPSPERMWHRFVTAIGLDSILEDGRFSDGGLRDVNQSVLNEILAAHVRQQTSETWLKRLHDGDVPCERLNSVADVPNDPTVKATGLIGAIMGPFGERQVVPRLGVSFPSMTADLPFNRAPLLGEDNETVLGEFED
jgi:crotonobetainyl-CoA:carnitine CoA-transferase CaiB-like acyl-CoA transferase